MARKKPEREPERDAEDGPEDGPQQPPGIPELLEKLQAVGESAVQEVAKMYRVPPNGDDRQRAFVEDTPLSQLMNAETRAASHVKGGPGRYVIELRERDRGFVVARATFHVLADLRPQSAAGPTVSGDVGAALLELSKTMMAVNARLERLERGPVAPSTTQQVSALGELVTLARSLVPGATSATPAVHDATELLNLGVKFGQAMVPSQAPGIVGALVQEHLPTLLEMGKEGLAFGRDVLKQRQLDRDERARGNTATPAAQPQSEDAREPDEVDGDGSEAA